MSAQYIDRPPRIQPTLPIDEIEIPGPPDTAKNASRQLLQVFTPMVTIIGYVFVSLFGGGRSIALLIPMALSVVISSVVAVISFVQDLRDTREQQNEYMRRLVEYRREMNEKHDEQRVFYHYNYPDIDTVMLIASRDERSRHGSRLWERRTGDTDFGEVRIGVGSRLSTVKYKVGEAKEGGANRLQRDANRLAEDAEWVQDVPITITLRPAQKMSDEAESASQKTTVVGSHVIGITAMGRGDVVLSHQTDFVRAMVMHLAAFHSPQDMRLYVIGAPESDQEWEWAKSLGHCNSERDLIGDLTCFELPDVEYETGERRRGVEKITPKIFWTSIKTELDNRDLKLRDRDKNEGGGDVTLPFLVVVVDLLKSKNHEHLQRMEEIPAVSLIMQNGVRLGAAIVFVVPEPSQLPSGCGAVIEVEQATQSVIFRYAQTGVNTPRYVGTLDRVGAADANEKFSQKIMNYRVIVSGTSIPKALTLLDLMRTNSIEELDIAKRWAESMKPENAKWLRVPIGAMSGGDIRELRFSADEDGVHGLVAGTTGSGKSEMLLTLIAGMAINYDPRILNFVLVDYKGGAAFAPFEPLPHCVDIVTNLQGKAVERMFDAIQAELDRRGAMLKDYAVKHVVEYREKGFHLNENNQPFPHLFIIVDEFAEMIQANSEFKSKFESIARLGRALGVSLILATQRPTGYVSDQMRANMKFRVCLRVEGGEDSRELLGRSDAAFLPSDIPGRAYVQIGNDNPMIVQVARTGGPHNEKNKEIIDDDILWLDENRPTASRIIDRGLEQDTNLEMRLNSIQNMENRTTQGETGIGSAEEARQPETMVDWVVEFARTMNQNNGIPVQRKPWPNPLPNPMPDPVTGERYPLPLNLGIDRTYVKLRKDDDYKELNPAVAQWMEVKDPAQAEWLPLDWGDAGIVLRTDVGLIDNPTKSEQLIMTVDLNAGPLAVFGASGWGKTTFLRTLIISLAASHSPRDLHIYALDFGSQGLRLLETLPHIGAILDSSDPNIEELVGRLIRMLEYFSSERKDIVTNYGSIIEYNRKHPNDVKPAILVVIDNFAEIKENYDEEIMMRIGRLARGGRAYGIYFVVATNQLSELSKLTSLFTEKITFKQADPTEYTNIIGRGAPLFDDIQGRGLIAVNRKPLVFQVAIPVLPNRIGGLADLGETEQYEELARAMGLAWASVLHKQTAMTDLTTAEFAMQINPRPVEILPEQILLKDILLHKAHMSSMGRGIARTVADFGVIVGINDIDRMPTILDLKKRGPHFIVVGPPFSGKTTVLRTLAVSLAYTYPPDEVAIVLIDPRRSLAEYGQSQGQTLEALPHVLERIYRPEQMNDFVTRLQLEFDKETVEKHKRGNPRFVFERAEERKLVVLIDNYGSFEEFAKGHIDTLSQLADKFARFGLHFVIAGAGGIVRQDALAKQAKEAGYGIGLQVAKSVDDLDGRVPYGTSKGAMPQGRGFIVKAGQTELIQTAMVYKELEEDHLEEWIKEIVAYYPDRAQWGYSGKIEDLSMGQDSATVEGPSDSGTPRQRGQRYIPKRERGTPSEGEPPQSS